MENQDMCDCGPDDDLTCDLTCDCPETFRRTRKGWQGKPPVAIDGKNWPVGFAAKTLGISERDLRDLIRITGLQPAGTMPMSPYRRSGRNPRVYDAGKLVMLWTAISELAASLDTPDL